MNTPYGVFIDFLYFFSLNRFYIVLARFIIKLKVLFVIPSKNSITGASLAIINIILGLLKKGIEVYVVASQPPPEYKSFLEELEKNNARMFFISSDESGWKYWRTLANKAIQVTKENDIKIVHLHLPKLVYFLGKKIKKLGGMIVMTVEGDPILEVKELDFLTRVRTMLMWKACMKYSDVICPCSNWLMNNLRERNKIPNMTTVHNPINLNRFSLASGGIRNSLGIHNDEFVVLTAARLTKVKGIDVLLKGFSDFVKKTNSKSTLLILGDGELQKQLKDLSEKLRIGDKVIFLGFKNNPQDYIAECDVFVMCSRYEPFGMPAAEAGALGIPVLTSKTGGLTEIIIHEKTGYQFEIGNYQELSAYLEKLFYDKKSRKQLGSNAREYVIEHFSPEIIADKMIQIYSKLII